MALDAHQETINKLAGNLTEDQVKAKVSREALAKEVTTDQLQALEKAVAEGHSEDVMKRWDEHLQLDQVRIGIDNRLKRLEADTEMNADERKTTRESLIKLRSTIDKSVEERSLVDVSAGELKTTAQEIFTKGTRANISLSRTGRLLAGFAAIFGFFKDGIMGLLPGTVGVFSGKIFNSVKRFLPSSVVSLFDKESGMQRRLEEHRKQLTATDDKYNLTTTIPTPATEDTEKSLVRGALEEISKEQKSIADLTLFPESERKQLQERRKILEDRTKELRAKLPEDVKKKAEEEAKKNALNKSIQEFLKPVTDTIATLPEGVNLMNPATERIINGVRVRFDSGTISLDGRALKIEASVMPAPFGDITLTEMRKNGGNLQAIGTYTIFPINTQFTPQQLATALARYKSNTLPFEEPGNSPVPHVNRFSLV